MIVPIGEYVLCDVLTEDKVTGSGLLLVDGAGLYKFLVLSVGDGRVAEGGTRVPMSVKPGDVVMTLNLGIVVNDKRLIRERDIVARVE